MIGMGASVTEDFLKEHSHVFTVPRGSFIVLVCGHYDNASSGDISETESESELSYAKRRKLN
jgi:hypothetical protein